MSKALLAAVMAALVAGCGPDEYQHRFRAGDCAQMRLDGRHGMILRAFIYSDALVIRFAARRLTTDTSVLGSDGDIEVGTYSTEYVSDFELEPCGERP